jgi:HD-like signal output (HDOD) protein
MTYRIELTKDAYPVSAAVPAPSALEVAVVQALEGGRAALPVLPDVAARALELANDPQTSVRDFAALINKDPPIAARFLATANSALYSRGQPVRSVNDAVARIGLAIARDLIFQVVYSATTSGLTRFKTEVQQSFRRSVLCGILCRIASPVLSLDLSDAYLCGLLHDIGESRIYRILSESKIRPSTAEAFEIVEKYHPRAGAELAMRWALPDEIVQVCRKHEEKGPTTNRQLRLVRLADLLVDRVVAPQGACASLPEEELATLEVTETLARVILERGIREAATL